MSARSPIDLPWPGIIAAALAVGGLIYYNTALPTSRPAQAGGFVTSVANDQNVNARAWEDPLAAAIAHSQQIAKEPEATRLSEVDRHMRAIIKNRVTPEAKKPEILVVVIPGGSLAEYGEARIRIRRAVLAAAAKSEWVPEDNERIGYVELGASPGASGEIIPFEWLSSTSDLDTQARRVILWVRQEDLGRQPLASLAKLLGSGGLDLDGCPIAIIGPRTSEALRDMVIEVSKNEPPPVFPTGTRLFAALPTASEKTLLKGVQGGFETTRQLFERRLPTVEFHRTIATDDVVLRALIDELELRGVDLKTDGTPGTIVLISEWDTFYGRTLPATFKELLPKTPVEKVVHYQYLRGIDGMTPGEASAKQSTKADSSDAAPDPGEIENTEGLNQTDYLRRLSQQLYDLNRKKIYKDGVGIRAVGVLGSDVYDKLLVLRALRKVLPDALFFTNNLDARMGHPHEWAAAHNLIVGSPYGLLVNDEYARLQGFRDSYQTSVYAAARMAMGDGEILTPPAPKLFEIGRNGPHELLQPSAAPDSPLAAENPNRILWWSPQRIWGAAGMVVVTVLALSWSIFVTAGRAKAEKEKRHASTLMRLFTHTSTYVVIVVGLAYAATWLLSCGGQGLEPGTWFEGISIWPTEFFRLTALGLSCVFIIRSHFLLRANEEWLGRKYFLTEESKNTSPPSKIQEGFFDRFLRHCRDRYATRAAALKKAYKDGQLPAAWDYFVRSVTLRSWDVEDGKSNVDVKLLWKRYLSAGSLVARMARVLPIALAYSLVTGALIKSFGAPTVPGRGAWSLDWDKAILTATVAMLILMTLYVVDATLLHRRFIHYLVKGTTKWPPEALAPRRKHWTVGPLPEGAREEEHPPEPLMIDYLDIQFIAKRTKVVGGLIYYPFIVLSLLIVARFAIFDNWTWPIALVAVMCATAGYALWSAFALRATAERARRDALRHLNNRLIAYVAMGDPGRYWAEMIREMQTIIREETRGAFAAISRHPIFGALLLPSGSAALLALSPYLPRLFSF